MAVPTISATTASTEFSGSFPATNATNRVPNAYWVASTSTGWLRVQYSSGFVARAYYVTMSPNEPNRAPAAWTFEGSNDGSSWTTLDTRSGQTSWVNPQQTRYFSFSNATSYSYYRLNVSANNGDGLLGFDEIWVSDVVVAATGAYSTEVLADSPRAFYRFSETSGAMAEDASGNHVSPIQFFSGYTRNATGLVADGDPAVALATNGYGRVIADANVAGLSAGAMTLEAVIKLTSLPDYSAIVSWDDNGSNRNVIFRVDPNGALTLVWWATNGAGPYVLSSSASTIVTSTTYHVAATHDGTNVALYVNGSSVASTTQSLGIKSARTINWLTVGSQNGPAYYFNGTLDDVAIYPTALSSTRIGVHATTAFASTTTGSGAVTAPAPTVAGSGTVTNSGTGAATAPAPTVSGSGTSTVTGSGAVTAPASVASGVGTSDDTTFGSGAVTAPAPTASGSGTSTVTGTGAVTAPAPTGSGAGESGAGDLVVSAPTPINASVAGFELGGAPAGTGEVYVVSAPTVIGGGVRIAPVPSPVPAGVEYRPIMRRAHLMDPKTAANPRKMGDPLRPVGDGDDGYLYPIHEEEIAARFRIFASGVDITFLTGAPTQVREWSYSKPFGPQAASFFVPLPEWNHPGPEGDMPIFWGDASIEIALEDDEGNLRHLWEGYTSEEVDVAAPGQTGVTWNCEGTFQQAAHWLWDPPRYMDPRDVGHVIADALNGVPNHRWATIPRFTTGVMTTVRGDSGQSVLSYVADLIGSTFDDDGNQLRLHRNGPYSYSLMWAYPITDPAHATFTKGSPGFESTLARPHYARRDMTFARGIAPDGGYWNGSVFPGLMAAAPPVYPMAGFANMVVGTTDADTVGGNGVTTWQRKMRELGYPVTVDGVINAADVKWIVKIEQDRGITDTGVLGPQTWSATWEGGTDTPETMSYRLPLSVKPNSRQYNYDASGKIVGNNPEFGSNRVLHATPEVDAGTNIKKTAFIPAAHKIRNREASPGYVGSLVATGVDPHETGLSRLFVNEGANIYVAGHHGGVTVQTADATHTPSVSRWTVDAGARGQAVVDAVLSRQKDARRSLAGKQTKVTDRGTLNASQLGQYESESPAGKYSRTAINGDAGLWTVRCIYVAEQGLARFKFTSSPNAEIVTAIFGRRVTANQIASVVSDPLASSDGWYDAEEELKEKYGLIEVLGTPDNPGGYFPRQKGEGALTGVQAAGNLSMKSQRGGFFWVGVFTSRSTFVQGEFEPEVSTA